MTSAAEQKLDYISLQVKVSDQTAVNERKYLREQLISIADGAFGREALNARNKAIKSIITGALAEFAKQIPQVDTSATIKAIDSKVDKVLSELDDVQGASAEKTIGEIINRLAPASDVMMSAAEVEALDNPIEEKGI